MSETKHTPGPWTYDARDGAISIYALNRSMRVCLISHAPEGAPPKRTLYPEDRGNAHLIAAAPELLDLARRVAEHFDGTDAPLGQAARAAVAKAEGK